jgi:hypothetical protein
MRDNYSQYSISAKVNGIKNIEGGTFGAEDIGTAIPYA